MRIVVNHLTRMDAPRICIAGIDPDAGRHIRPTTDHQHPLTRDLLASEGGPFALGALIELGSIGLATTHDLALTELRGLGEGVLRNVHFEDHLENGRMRFDYLLREGVVTKSNGLELMRAIGLRV